ncbi:hypothetical protein FS837_007564 [Tulasnella sp. UAMH 9824]|nr:hypothetical protein FS837_007564 [Tulasnella sp. UAMH 9824]
MSEEKGASNNERLLHAAREDNVDLLEELLEDDDLDINYKDGLGNTALHYAAQKGSVDVIEMILGQEGCDVDLKNRVDGETPLHLACKLEDEDTRSYIIDQLLDAGADMSIKDKHGSLAIDLLPGDDQKNRDLFRKHQATNAISAGDIAEGIKLPVPRHSSSGILQPHLIDSDGEPGSGSDED